MFDADDYFWLAGVLGALGALLVYTYGFVSLTFMLIYVIIFVV